MFNLINSVFAHTGESQDFSNMMGGGDTSNMMNYMFGGGGWGWPMMIFGWLFAILVLVVLILLIMWLIKQIQK